MSISELKKAPNKDAIEVLEEALERAKNGDIVDVAISFVTTGGGISGDCSGGSNQIMMWAALEHHCKSFYKNVICEEYS
jgi:hypothetical protein